MTAIEETHELEKSIDDCESYNHLDEFETEMVSHLISDTSSVELTSDSENSSSATIDQIQWNHANGLTLHQFPVTFQSHDPIHPQGVYQYFTQLINDDVMAFIATETNRNARRKFHDTLIDSGDAFFQWKDTYAEEMRRFFGLIMYMGLVIYPSIDDYWSQDVIFKNDFCRSVMQPLRFKILLRYMSFGDDNDEKEKSKFSKVDKLLKICCNNFQSIKTPNENLIVMDDIIKSGLTLTKLVDSSGYIYNTIVHNENNSSNNHITKNCIELIKPFLNEGRTLTVDEQYTTIDLAKSCLAAKTHLQGLITPTSPGFPKLNSTLGTKCYEHNGIVIGIWKNKNHSVRFISTKHDGRLEESQNDKGATIKSPNIIKSYYTCLKSLPNPNDLTISFTVIEKLKIRWYHQVAFELICNVAIINAFHLYQSSDCFDKNIVDFRKSVIMYLTQTRTHNTYQDEIAHILIEDTTRSKSNRKKRRRCVKCYQALAECYGKVEATKKTRCVSTYCGQCPRTPFICLKHFMETHNFTGMTC